MSDHRRRHVLAAVEVGAIQAAEQSDTDADLLESAFPHVSPEDIAEPFGRHALGVNREICHPPSPWMTQAYEILGAMRVLSRNVKISVAARAAGPDGRAVQLSR